MMMMMIRLLLLLLLLSDDTSAGQARRAGRRRVSPRYTDHAAVQSGLTARPLPRPAAHFNWSKRVSYSTWMLFTCDLLVGVNCFAF